MIHLDLLIHLLLKVILFQSNLKMLQYFLLRIKEKEYQAELYFKF
jgi:hypothetical protein